MMEEPETPSLHILIATTGRSSLLAMLKSLYPQLKANDYLTIIFDGKDDNHIFKKVKKILKKFPCLHSLIMEPINLGHYGHGIRNYHNHLAGDFIMHADDDGIYVDNAMEIVRSHCKDKDTLYIFKMLCKDGFVVWIDPEILFTEIGTPMGVIPAAYNSQSTWSYRYGGDFKFYDTLQKIIPKIEFIDHVIYLSRIEKKAQRLTTDFNFSIQTLKKSQQMLTLLLAEENKTTWSTNYNSRLLLQGSMLLETASLALLCSLNEIALKRRTYLQDLTGYVNEIRTILQENNYSEEARAVGQIAEHIDNWQHLFKTPLIDEQLKIPLLAPLREICKDAATLIDILTHWVEKS